jgi:carboxyl-terminal processing protease
MQDHHRAVILGSQTFGKGSVQTIIPMQDGSGLKLTTAQYYTPNGRVIQAKGIEPDIEVSNKIEDKGRPIRFLREKDLERHLENNEGEKGKEGTAPEEGAAAEPEEPVKDAQLTRALEILKSWDIFEQMQQEARAVAMDDASTAP